MKPEPLKDKKIKGTIHLKVISLDQLDGMMADNPNFFKENRNKRFVMVDDLKSAVRWLKRELRKITLPKDVKFREKLIDKAFEDVVKK